MPISKINTGAIHDEAVTTPKIEDAAVTLPKTDNLFLNTEIDGTEAARMPVGTTAQRANAQQGDIRFNTTTNLMEYYDGVLWKSIDAPPTLSAVSPDNFNAAGETITLTGNNFGTGATVKVIGTDGTEYSPSSVTVVGSTTITFQTTAAMASATTTDPFDVKVTNVSGLSAILEDILDSQPTPAFTTSSGLLGSIYNIDRGNKTFTIAATSADPDDTITYAVTSGSLPTGMSLNSSTGVISGTPNQETAGTNTNYPFTVTATATGESATATNTRNFSITVYGEVSLTFEYSSDNYQTWSVPADLESATVEMWGAGGGSYHDGSTENSQGGAGGYAKSTINILSSERGQNWYVIVGQGGGSNAVAGYSGGGNGANGGGGGGGASLLLSSAAALTTNPFVATSSGTYGTHWRPSSELAGKSGASEIVLVAGAGGGGGWYVYNDRHGAMGGGLTGGQSQGSYGGTQTSGGDGGGNYDEPGGFLYGGYVSNNASSGGSGGAGGGWYGGGTYQTSTGGANYGGAGGSSFIGFADGSTSTVLTATGSYGSYSDSITRTNGTRTYTNSETTRSGDLIRTPVNTSSSYYIAGSGSVGYAYGSRDATHEPGGNGLVTIRY